MRSFIVLLLLITSCHVYPVYSQDITDWPVGTYTGILEDFSEEQLVNTKESGIDYLELSINPLLRMSHDEQVRWIHEFSENVSKAGLKVWSVHMPWSNTLDISSNNEDDRLATIKEHVRVMEILEPLNIQKYVMHPSAEPISDEERESRLNNSVISLKVLTEEAKRFSGSIAMEAMPRTLLANTSDEALYILERVDNGLEICLDTNHVLQENTEDFIRAVGDNITTIHVADYDGIDEKHWLPNRGVINWNNVIDELVKINFQGPWMYEVVRREGDDPMPTPSLLVETWLKLKNNYLQDI